jgi:hypothetical protein
MSSDEPRLDLKVIGIVLYTLFVTQTLEEIGHPQDTTIF